MRARSLDCGDRGFRIRLRCGAVVVNGNGLGAVRSQIASDQATQVLTAAGDEDVFTLDAMVGHGISLGNNEAAPRRCDVAPVYCLDLPPQRRVI